MGIPAFSVNCNAAAITFTFYGLFGMSAWGTSG